MTVLSIVNEILEWRCRCLNAGTAFHSNKNLVVLVLALSASLRLDVDTMVEMCKWGYFRLNAKWKRESERLGVRRRK